MKVTHIYLFIVSVSSYLLGYRLGHYSPEVTKSLTWFPEYCEGGRQDLQLSLPCGKLALCVCSGCTQSGGGAAQLGRVGSLAQRPAVGGGGGHGQVPDLRTRPLPAY